MNGVRDAFAANKLYFRAYLIWKTPNANIREYHLHIAKKDLEIARAFLNVERRKVHGI